MIISAVTGPVPITQLLQPGSSTCNTSCLTGHGVLPINGREEAWRVPFLKYYSFSPVLEVAISSGLMKVHVGLQHPRASPCPAFCLSILSSTALVLLRISLPSLSDNCSMLSTDDIVDPASVSKQTFPRFLTHFWVYHVSVPNGSCLSRACIPSWRPVASGAPECGSSHPETQRDPPHTFLFRFASHHGIKVKTSVFSSSQEHYPLRAAQNLFKSPPAVTVFLLPITPLTPSTSKDENILLPFFLYSWFPNQFFKWANSSSLYITGNGFGEIKEKISNFRKSRQVESSLATRPPSWHCLCPSMGVPHWLSFHFGVWGWVSLLATLALDPLDEKGR